MASSAVDPSPVGIVLSGGRSRRMGTDKATLIVDGVSLLDRAVQALHDAAIEHVVIAGATGIPDPESETPGYEPQGPLAGIVSAWEHLRFANAPNTVAVLSCDLPAIPGHVMSDLLDASREHRHGAVAHDGERPQPLIAVYHAAALDELRDRFLGGERSVRRCFAGWDLGICPFDRQLLLDADRPEDLHGFDVQWPSR